MQPLQKERKNPARHIFPARWEKKRKGWCRFSPQISLRRLNGTSVWTLEGGDGHKSRTFRCEGGFDTTHLARKGSKCSFHIFLTRYCFLRW